MKCGVNKSEIRAQMVAALRSARRDDAGRRSASEAICAAIRRHAAWTDARLIAAFFPLPSEPQIAPLWESAGSHGFCFPRVRGTDVELIRIDDPDLLRRADWKLALDELAASPIVAPDAVDLFLVPGLAFTAAGLRLGRGGGYYDRLLSRRAPASTALGVCFHKLLIAHIPHEPHDQSVTAVITERGTFP